MSLTRVWGIPLWIDKRVGKGAHKGVTRNLKDPKSLSFLLRIGRHPLSEKGRFQSMSGF